MVLMAAVPAAMAQAFPSRPVKIIVPYSAGTAADIVARRLGQKLGEMWGQGVVIENQAGAGGNIGAANVAKAPADGYTLLMITINHVINPSLYNDIPYDIPRDFKPIARVASGPLAIVASPKFAPSSIRELIAAAKAKPGTVYFGSGGNGSITHLAFELIKSQAGIQMTHVPYKSVAPMLTDIMSNQVALGAPAAASVVGHYKAGTLKVLGMTTPHRSSLFPDVPTLAEQGLTGYDVSTWNGLAAPSRTPDAIIDKINADVQKAVQDAGLRDQLSQQAMDISYQGPAAFAAFVKVEQDKWTKLVKETGAKLD